MIDIGKMSAKERTGLTKDKAKIILVLRAMWRLADQKPATMREIFAPATDDEANIKVIANVAMSKSWQRAVVDRLIELRLVNRVTPDGRTHMYQAVDMDKLIDMANSEECAKWLLYPASYEKPDIIADKTGPSDHDTPDDGSETTGAGPEQVDPESVSEGSILEQSLVAILVGMREVASHLAEVRKTQGDLGDRVSQIEKLVSALDQKAEGNWRQNREKMSAVDQRLDDARKRQELAISLSSDAKREANMASDGVSKIAKILAELAFMKAGSVSPKDMSDLQAVLCDKLDRLEKMSSLSDQVRSIREQHHCLSEMAASLCRRSQDIEAGVSMALDVVGELENGKSVKHG